MNVLKLAVSSCSQLEKPTQRPQSVIFDSTWSLDKSAFQRQELPGKTLVFAFDVTAAFATVQDSQELPQKSDSSWWKRPQLSQVFNISLSFNISCI